MITKIWDVNRSVLELLQSLQEILPNSQSLIRPQGRVMESQLYPRLECLIEGSDAVAREDEYALVVLEYAQKD